MVNQVKGIKNQDSEVILEGSNVTVVHEETGEVLHGMIIKTSAKQLQLKTKTNAVRLFELVEIKVEIDEEEE